MTAKQKLRKIEKAIDAIIALEDFMSLESFGTALTRLQSEENLLLGIVCYNELKNDNGA